MNDCTSGSRGEQFLKFQQVNVITGIHVHVIDQHYFTCLAQ